MQSATVPKTHNAPAGKVPDQKVNHTHPGRNPSFAKVAGEPFTSTKPGSHGVSPTPAPFVSGS